jgi:hypothetical protein
MRIFCSGYTVFTRVSSYADFILEASERLLIESPAAESHLHVSKCSSSFLSFNLNQVFLRKAHFDTEFILFSCGKLLTIILFTCHVLILILFSFAFSLRRNSSFLETIFEQSSYAIFRWLFV